MSTPLKQVLVTTSWDDGHKHDLRLAQLLKKYGIKGTFYISPKDREFLGEQMLTTSQVRVLAKDFEIGAHTMTHPRLSMCDAETARQEIMESKLRLEQAVGHEVTSFCYPYGDFSQETKQIVREAGFRYARSVRRFATRSIDRFAAETSVDTFDHLRTGMMSVIRIAGRRPWRALLLRRWDYMAKEMFYQARDRGEVFHLWGHSHEIEAHGHWDRLERFLQWLVAQPNVTFITNAEVPIQRPKLLVTTPYFKPHTGGLEEYAFQTAKGLQEDHGWDVVVATSDDCKQLQVEDYEGVKVYRLPISRKISNTPIGLHWRRTLRQIIADERPDLIDAHGPVPGMLDITSRVVHRLPFVVTYHMGSMKKEGRGLINGIIWVYEHVLLKTPLHKARMIIASSPFVQRSYLGKYFYKSVAVMPGINARVFKPAARKPGAEMLLAVGGLKPGEEHKGLETVLYALARLKRTHPRMRLTIVGEGSLQPYYQDLARSLGIAQRVTFAGRLVGKQMAEAYRQADIFVSPSSKESFGMTILEALACGLPVIAGNVEGVPYLIEDGANGLLVAPHDPGGLADKINWITKHQSEAVAMGKAGRKLAANKYKWQSTVAETDQTLRTALGMSETNHKPKLMLATPYYAPKVGGLENYAQHIASQLQNRGWEVCVVTSNHNGNKLEADEVDGVRVYRLPTIARLSNTPIGLLWPYHMRRIIKYEKPDIINGHTPVPGIADCAAIAAGKTPFMLTYHAATLYKQGDALFNAVISGYRIIEKLMFGKAAKIITVTPYHKDKLSEAVRAKFALIENAIPTGDLLKAAATKQPQHVVFIGNLVKAHAWKGLEEILQAVALYKQRESRPIHLDVVGGGEYLRHYQNVAKRLGIVSNVTFHGQKTGADKYAILDAASAFICYPTTAQDAFPTVILEAWARRTPVIAAEIGAIPHIINAGEDGLLAVPHNPDALAIVIATVLENRQLQQTLIANGYERAKRQTWDIQGAKTDELFRGAIK